MSMRPSVGLLLVSALSLARGAAAQGVRGVVITPDSALVPGVIVTLIDAAGTPVARALADDAGRFTMRAPVAGVYRIEAKRLAFRPTLDVPITLEEGRTLLHTLVLTSAPVLLERVRISATQECDVHPDSGSAAFEVWEEARKALRSSQLTRLTRPYRVDLTTFVYRSGATVSAARTDSAQQFGMPIRPFTSRPAEQLEARGYLTRGNRVDVFHAPDEDVLLSESFASTHCFRLLADSGGSERVRLGFSPVRGRKQTDIVGVLTIDRASSELRRLDFSFVNLPAMDVVGAPGGEIVFRRLLEGTWFIERWAIWIPVAEFQPEVGARSAPVSVRGTPRPAPVGVTTRVGLQTTGGHVTRVFSGDETVWSTALRPPL
jgi:hypothetical protein